MEGSSVRGWVGTARCAPFVLIPAMWATVSFILRRGFHLRSTVRRCCSVFSPFTVRRKLSRRFRCSTAGTADTSTNARPLPSRRSTLNTKETCNERGGELGALSPACLLCWSPYLRLANRLGVSGLFISFWPNDASKASCHRKLHHRAKRPCTHGWLILTAVQQHTKRSQRHPYLCCRAVFQRPMSFTASTRSCSMQHRRRVTPAQPQQH